VSIPDGLGPEDERNERDKLCEAILLTMPEKLEELIININNSNGDDDKISCIGPMLVWGGPWKLLIRWELKELSTGLHQQLRLPCNSASQG
jgi:hypothetical protein